MIADFVRDSNDHGELGLALKSEQIQVGTVEF